MAMRTVILDSSPSIPLHDPTNVSLNVSPVYTLQTKRRGQPLLGQKQVQYTHFVPMGEGSDHIKELLGLEDTDDSESKPIESKNELLKAEKIMKGEENSSSIDPTFDSKLEKEAKEFMVAPPEIHNEVSLSTNEHNDESNTNSSAKNDAEIATLISATQPIKTSTNMTSKPKKKKASKKDSKKDSENEEISNNQKENKNVCKYLCKLYIKYEEINSTLFI